MQVRGGFRRDPGTASCFPEGPLSATCPPALPRECSSLREWMRLDSRGWARNLQPDAMRPPTSAHDGLWLAMPPNGSCRSRAHSLAGRQRDLGTGYSGAMEPGNPGPADWKSRGLDGRLLAPASTTGHHAGRPPNRGCPENPARRIASSTPVSLRKHVTARLPLLCPLLMDPSIVLHEACLWGPAVSSGGRCCAVAGIDGPQAGLTQTVHDGPGCGNDSASKYVVGGDPDDVPVGSLSGQAELDVVVGTDGERPCRSGETWDIGLLGQTAVRAGRHGAPQRGRAVRPAARPAPHRHRRRLATASSR